MIPPDASNVLWSIYKSRRRYKCISVALCVFQWSRWYGLWANMRLKSEAYSMGRLLGNPIMYVVQFSVTPHCLYFLTPSFASDPKLSLCTVSWTNRWDYVTMQPCYLVTRTCGHDFSDRIKAQCLFQWICWTSAASAHPAWLIIFIDTFGWAQWRVGDNSTPGVYTLRFCSYAFGKTGQVQAPFFERESCATLVN